MVSTGYAPGNGPGNSPGRPRILADPAKRRTVCAMISIGGGLETAARHVGCSTWTIRREAARDEAFARQLQDAQTAAELMPLRMVRQAAETQWRAAAWLLERICPERFARRRPDTVSPAELKGLLDQTAAILVDECFDEQQRGRVMSRLRELQEDHFGERRAKQQGPPEAPAEIDRLLARSGIDGLAAQFGDLPESFGKQNSPRSSARQTHNPKGGNE